MMKAYNWAEVIDSSWVRHDLVALVISLAALTLNIGALIIFAYSQNLYIVLGTWVATIVALYYAPAGDSDRDIPDKIDIPDNPSVWYIEPDQHTEALKTLQTQSQKAQEFNETFFLTQVWLNMCTFLVQPEETLEKKYASLDWLREFTGSHPFDRSQADPSSPAHQSPNPLLGNFSQSFKKFSEAPDEFILCLQQYDTDVRDRDLAEYLTVYALRIDFTESLWYLVEKIAQIERNSHTLEEADRATISAEIQARMEDCDMEAKMRTFMQGRLKDHARDGDQVGWFSQMELHRKVILLLRSTHHKRCRHYTVDLLLGMLHDAFDEIFKLPSPVRNFRSSVMAFVEALSGNRPGDAPDVADPDNFRDAINSLREISKRRDPQLRYLYDEIQTLRAEIATHERIITCLEYRHVLESLPQKSSLKNNGLLAKTKDATTIWKHTWKLAVEKQLTAMLEAKIDERIVASGNAAPQRTATHSDLHLETLLRFDFEYWVRTNPKDMANMVKSTTPNVASVNYSDWRSHQRGHQLYGELSTNIHAYGKTYKFKKGAWLKDDALIMDWLKPEVQEGTQEDDGVDWANEYTSRKLPT